MLQLAEKSNREATDETVKWQSRKPHEVFDCLVSEPSGTETT